jgi:hypothetical protein
MGNLFNVFLSKGLYMGEFKLALNSMFGGVFEIQINEDGGTEISPSLFHQVQRTSVLNKEIVMEQVQELRVFFRADGEVSFERCHTC